MIPITVCIGYAIQPMKDSVLRLYFFTNKENQNTLLANLLPFTTSDPIHFKELEVVY
ncbi:MAG: hypothetical protein KZQ90_10680 [Candidatus Thiodiazotropha sp. (ex Codakia rugifera)]|nr:hypothetical protein [Candidatus Thiodiazotropha sp. (ex Codakia rugifera)]